jgi:hypothetical protein
MGKLKVWLPVGVGVLVAAMILVFWLRSDDGEAAGAGGRRTVVVTATARLSGTHMTARAMPAPPLAVATAPHGMPADHCDLAWVDEAMLRLGVAPNQGRTVRGCDGTWLVMDVSQPEASRWFMLFGPHGWQQVTVTKEAGCAAVHSVQPAFPSSLCANLPAVG